MDGINQAGSDTSEMSAGNQASLPSEPVPALDGSQAEAQPDAQSSEGQTEPHSSSQPSSPTAREEEIYAGKGLANVAEPTPPVNATAAASSSTTTQFSHPSDSPSASSSGPAAVTGIKVFAAPSGSETPKTPCE
jgi:hypothetical protein